MLLPFNNRGFRAAVGGKQEGETLRRFKLSESDPANDPIPAGEPAESPAQPHPDEPGDPEKEAPVTDDEPPSEEIEDPAGDGTEAPTG
jgi:hypothetical protein